MIVAHFAIGPPAFDFPVGRAPYAIVIADLNDDHRPDLAIANSSSTSSAISVLRNKSSAQGIIAFAARSDYATGAGPHEIMIGDFDGDGRSDLAVANIVSDTVTVLRRMTSDGEGVSFAPRLDFSTGSYPGSMAIGDMDGDGLPDLVTINNKSDNVSVLRNLSSRYRP